MQIAVLGMHRSGTSALTRLLGLIGCRLGDPGDFNPVRPDNPAGDWERSDVWALNEDVLRALGATWCRIQDFDAAALEPADRAQLEARAQGVVAALDAAGRPWAIKDPRLCLTFSVWRAALNAPVCVLIQRDPLAVARSLRRRDGFPLAVGLALWEAHALGALRHSRGLPRVAVEHRDLMRDPVATLASLRRDLEALGVGGLHKADPQAVRTFIDPALLHESSDAAEQAAGLTPGQERLAAALKDGSALAWDAVPDWSAAARDLVAGYFRLQEALAAMTADRDRQAAGFRHKAEEVERLAASRDAAEVLARKSGELERQNEELDRRTADLAAQVEALERRVRSLATLGEDLARRNLDLSRRNSDLEHAGAEAAEAARAGLAERDERVRRAEEDLDRLVRQATELERLIDLILASRRFRYGDQAGELLGRLLRRPAQPRAAEHARRIAARLREVCAEIARRRGEPAVD